MNIPITDKQFLDAYTTAGAYFTAMYMEKVMINIRMLNDDKEAKNNFVKDIYKSNKVPDDDISWTRLRVNCLMRIVNAGRAEEALEKVRNSNVAALRYPMAVKVAERLLMKLQNTGEGNRQPM